jgi:hypothetical protein
MDEGMVGGGQKPCMECGGTGMVYEDPKPVPAHVQSKVDKYKTLVKATKAAHKRLDANHNGVPDDEESVDEEFTDKSKTGDTFKTRTGVATKTDTGMKHSNTSYHDDGEAEEKSGKGIKTHAKAKDAETKKAEKGNDIKLPKHDKPTYGMKNGEKFDNRPKEKDVDESLGLGMYEAKSKKSKKDYDGDGKVESPKDEVWGSRAKAAAKAGHPFKEAKEKCCCEEKGKMKCPVHKPMNEAERTMSRAAKGVMKYGKDGMKALAKAGKEGKDLDKVRDKYDKYDESAKPSAGLSKAKKSAVVKDAKAGKDIGKPGKSFDKTAKAAGGGEKGEKIAAAAMWKNMKETVAYMAEKKAAVKDLPGNQEKIDADHDGKIEKSDLAALRAGKKEKETVKESADFNRMKELMQRLNG